MAASLGNQRSIVGLVFLALMALCTLHSSPAHSSTGGAYMMRLDGAIGPATASFIIDGLEQAEQGNAELVIISMDTPGGLDTSMRDIIQAILGAQAPVVTYVHPSGARAASAGTYILYASHIAAMTPGTNLGAATPIQIGVTPSPDTENQDQSDEIAPANASERKAVNDAVAYIRSLAEMRGRNADWAEQAVREAASLSADAALEQNVIDIVAPNLASLIAQLDGMTVTMNGEDREIDTAGLTVTEIEPSWSAQLLATITNPNIALILMMIGIYGIIFEFLNPGALVPGTVGAICLLIGSYALAVLPVDIVGLALILLGIGLMIGEAFAPSFGILGIGGLVSLMFGATILFDTDVPEFQVDWSVIAAVGVFSAGLIILVARVGISSFKHKVVTGSEELIGASATVIDWSGDVGHVLAHSERWNAEGPEGLSEGDTVQVVSRSGLTLTVSSPGDADR